MPNFSQSGFLIDIGQGLSMIVGIPTIPSWKTSERPGSPKPGTFGFNSETISIEYFDGTSWFSATMQ